MRAPVEAGAHHRSANGSGSVAPVELKRRALTQVARQLGHPQGLAGRLVAAGLDRTNAREVQAAVDATHAGAGATVADLGFGGGVGLSLLLDRVGATGTVHGIDISDAMLARARRRHADALSAGRLVLRAGSLTALPLPDASLDAFITTNTVYFVDDLAAAFADMARALAPSGRGVVGLGDARAMASMPFTAYGFRLRDVDDVVETARAAGLAPSGHDRVGDRATPFHVLTFARS